MAERYDGDNAMANSFGGDVVYLSCDNPSPCLVTWCATLMYSHRVGLEYHIRHVDEQIPLLVYMPQPTPLETQETPFSITLLWCDG
jgi:hypothetical protein